MIDAPQALIEVETGSRTMLYQGQPLALSHPCHHILVGRAAAQSGTVPALAPSMMADVLLTLDHRSSVGHFIRSFVTKSETTNHAVAVVHPGGDAAHTDVDMLKGWMSDCARRWTQRSTFDASGQIVPVLVFELLPPALSWLFDFAPRWGVSVWLPAPSQAGRVWELISIGEAAGQDGLAQALLVHCSWLVQTTGEGGSLLLTSSRERPGWVIGPITNALRKRGLTVQVRPNGRCLDGLRPQ